MNETLNEIGFRRLGKYFVFELWQIIFDLLPYSPLRIIWMKIAGAKLGSGCVVEKADFINLDRFGLKGLQVGNKCFIGRGALLDTAGEIILENEVTVSAKASILSHFSVGFNDHPLIKKFPKVVAKTTIQKGSFIGLGSIVLPGVIIGRECMIGAGSVVTKNIASFCTAAGVPAKNIKK